LNSHNLAIDVSGKENKRITYSDFGITHELWVPKKMAEQVFFNILCYFSPTMTYTDKPYTMGSEKTKHMKIMLKLVK